jgi:hypothetical protein
VHILSIVIAKAEFKDSACTQLLEPFVYIMPHFIVVLICLVAQSKHLKQTMHVQFNVC